jgi:DNA-damage-inducible protein J
LKTTTLTTRVDAEIKARAEATVEPLGLTLSRAMNIFLYRLIAVGGIPFDVVQPRCNAETEAAIAEADGIAAGRVPAKRFATVEEMWVALGPDDDE